MRRARLLKRRKVSGFLFFAALSWVGLGMGVDIKGGLMQKDFSVFLENRLSSIFVDKQIKLSRIEGGGFRKFAIYDFSISKKSTLADSGNPLPIFSVDKILINYNPVDLALRRFEKLEGVYLISPSLFLAQDQSNGFALPHGGSSYFRVGSTYSSAPVKLRILNGSIRPLGKSPILSNLEGGVTFSNSNLILNNMKGAFLNIPVSVNGRVENILESPAIKLRLSIKDKNYRGTCSFKSIGQKGKGAIWVTLRIFDRLDVRFKGRINIASGENIEITKLVVADPASGKTAVVISGDINLITRSSKFVIIPKAGSPFAQTGDSQIGLISVIGEMDKEKGLSVDTGFNHVNLFGYDVLSQVNLDMNLHKAPDSQEMLKGSLRTQNSILNYKPFQEIEASWIVRKGELFITNFQIGDHYRIFGKIKLAKPYDFDLNLSVNDADLRDWLIFLRSNKDDIGLSGFISGKIKVKGPLAELFTDGKLNIENGHINDVKFNNINFNLKGKGPILTLSDSRIFKEGGCLYVDGEVDLRKIGKRNLFEEIKIETDQKVIVWEGWDITKDTSQIQAKKDLGEEFGINFKTYANDSSAYGDKKKSEIGLDYRIKKDDSINIKMKDDSAFVGVEHKVKF
jgi:hypothetical protein